MLQRPPEPAEIIRGMVVFQTVRASRHRLPIRLLKFCTDNEIHFIKIHLRQYFLISITDASGWL